MFDRLVAGNNPCNNAIELEKMTPPSSPASARTTTCFGLNNDVDGLISWMYVGELGSRYCDRINDPSSNSCCFWNFATSGPKKMQRKRSDNVWTYFSKRCDCRLRSIIRPGVLEKGGTVPMARKENDAENCISVLWHPSVDYEGWWVEQPNLTGIARANKRFGSRSRARFTHPRLVRLEPLLKGERIEDPIDGGISNDGVMVPKGNPNSMCISCTWISSISCIPFSSSMKRNTRYKRECPEKSDTAGIQTETHEKCVCKEQLRRWIQRSESAERGMEMYNRVECAYSMTLHSVTVVGFFIDVHAYTCLGMQACWWKFRLRKCQGQCRKISQTNLKYTRIKDIIRIIPRELTDLLGVLLRANDGEVWWSSMHVVWRLYIPDIGDTDVGGTFGIAQEHGNPPCHFKLRKNCCMNE